MKRTLLIIGTDFQWEEQELMAIAKSLKHPIHFLDAHHVDIRIGKMEAELFYEGKNMTNAFKKSRVIFRRARGDHEKMISLSLLAQNWNVPFTDSVISIMSNLNKAIALPATTTKLIRHIPTHFVGSGESLAPGSLSFSFPLLAKPVHGRHGKGVEILRNKTALACYIRRNNRALMIQPFLPVASEYRVFVVGGLSLGVIQKIPKRGSSIANYAAGAQFLPARMAPQILEEVVRLCREQGVDIGGVDLAKVGNDFYLLEINRCPEFKAFSEATGQNVAQAIVRFALSK
ncbi:MAG: hypothetical protein V1760_01540 [Candidatus Peregrinibacteria bacterium]